MSQNTRQYTTPFLLPGDYDVAIKFAGFKEYVGRAFTWEPHVLD
jgi:hypothetical protein